MGRIKALPENIIGKIAAGEVVERPAAAIKELVENSLDAGATSVSVEIREGGLSYIRVTDNGCGIDPSDIRMAFERHATSKISDEKDLNAIATLGFRGEALASIAAVSRMTMSTRTAAQETGIKVQNEGGRITEIEETACPTGTSIVVRDLFYNVPVRKGFMKKPGQEASQVGDLMMKILLSRPDVSFRFVSDGKKEYHSPGNGQLSSALHAVYGGQVFKTLRKVEDHMNGLMISGYVGIGENARGNRNQELFFINHRVMNSQVLCNALETACRERVMIGKFPICALHIEIPYEAVDVNVHPNKLEVRFRDESGVYEALLTVVVEALKERDAFEKPTEMKLTSDPETNAAAQTTGTIPPESIRTSPAASVTTRRTVPETAAVAPAAKPQPVYAPVRPTVQTPVCFHQPDGKAPIPENDAAEATHAMAPAFRETAPAAEQLATVLPEVRKPLRIFGALFNTFILIEYEDHLLMVDQHAVHERLLFDRLMKEQAGARRMGQELLVPIIIPVTKHEQKLVEDNRELLESISLFAEAFGDRDLAVRTIPMILGEAQTRDFVMDVIDELEKGKNPGEDKKRAALLQSACKHAVKGGEPLGEDELRHLAEQMIEQKVTPTCPHGRPLVVSISHHELDRKFKRIQN